ncbi:MAG TPA: DNA mismatch repair protein MutS [Thermoanaerobaculia bacterium]|nr:DNA mismatch repair protein MutS [Thermoanaerobaculia bacterium]
MPATTYRERAAAFSAEERRLARISFRFSVGRGSLFFGFVATLLAILIRASLADARLWLLAGGWLVAFLLVLPWHDRVIQRQRRAAALRDLNEEALHRLGREWDLLPVPRVPEVMAGDHRARDLDLFGRASLVQLLGTAHTPAGRLRLAGWLLRPALPDEIALRQAAVRELAPDVEFRQQLEVRTRPMESAPPDVEPFLRWAEAEPWLLARPGLVWLTRVLPPVTVGLILAAFMTPLPAYPAWLAIAVNFFLMYRCGERLEGAFNQVEARERDFRTYAEAMAMAVSRSAAAPALRRTAETLGFAGRPAHAWMKLLDSRIGLADARRNPILRLPIELLFLWDFHALWLLERWQQAAGKQARGWLEALGELEALSALAGLRHDNPGWDLPVVAPGEDRFAARGLGHPLIPEERRVPNDVELGPAGTFLLVTGSNMSGKSTLLRAIGLNAVLAQAGGPVCAEALRMPPVELATSILVEDSLAGGVSFFMAELLRIRGVVETADRSRAAGHVLLYLLDEILRGTNSSERQVAVRRVILHLLKSGAIGAVSSHDLQVAEIPELSAASRPVHFRETLHPGEETAMTFDYRMRPGIATTTNALKLMELVGLPPDDFDTR